MPTISNPDDLASAIELSRLSFLRLQITTFAPASAYFNAMAFPIPFEPPETMAVFTF